VLIYPYFLLYVIFVLYKNVPLITKIKIILQEKHKKIRNFKILLKTKTKGQILFIFSSPFIFEKQ
jgi:hypothetical protein